MPMKVAVFNAKSYDREFLTAANTKYHHELAFFPFSLTADTVTLASGYPAVSVFINSTLNAGLLKQLADLEVKLIATRSAGFNHIDLAAAKELNLCVVRVPAYSPYAVAEHTVGLILSLNRKIHRAYNRVRDDNFSLEGLLGFDLHGSVVGIIGTGTIGLCFARIMHGFGCKLLAYDVQQNPACLELGVEYLPLLEVLAQSDIVSLHCPLLPETFHLINAETLQHLKPGAMLINTSRGALIDTKAAIEAIKSGRIGYLGIDVYEQEENLFFEDLSDTVIQDDVFQLLQSFSNVLITAHQAFFTRNALTNIAETTLSNITEFEQTGRCKNTIAMK
jgi:D-lactate dehydrogenase